MDAWVVVTTVGSAEDARRLAHEVVDRRLAACVQLSRIDSVYRWQGAVQEDAEVRVVFKTVADRLDELERTVRELHPYELPQLLSWRVDRADPGYADWIEAETRPADG